MLVQFALSGHPSRDQVDYWTGLGDEMTALLAAPERTRLVVTDQFAKVVSDLEQAVPRENGPAEDRDQQYDPAKPDGSLATARTLPLLERTVVVVNAGLPVMGLPAVRRIVHHESQHVRLHETDDSAWAMQRRASFERPTAFGFDYVYLAQSMIDEFRCEAAVSPAVTGDAIEMNETVDGYAAIADLFVAIRDRYFRSGDLATAYNALLGALNRLGPYVAYAIATITRGETTIEAWGDVAPVGLAAETLLGLPPAGTKRGYPRLADDVVDAVGVLDAISRRLGFSIGVDEVADRTLLYFL